MLKRSRQRDAILEYLNSTTSHPTADQIYSHVREKFPNISLGTVYRNLSLLTAIGEVRKLSFGDDVDHFDANTAPHCHILCTCCNRIEDFYYPFPDTLDQTAGDHYEGRIFGHSILFYGLCRECAQKSSQSASS